jgi:hypothetical protein
MATKAIYQMSPGLALFATTYDPLDLASDSIDPLGFLKVYLALADRLLPGFTTVTSVPRYLPMLCAGLRAAEKVHPRDENREPAKARAQRLEILRHFEKLWALACGLAAEQLGDSAIAGLRGVRYVRNFLNANVGRADVSVGEFNLLSNQVRYGGIGTYGQMLESCHFADWTSLTLRPLGEKLADCFPLPSGWAPERSSLRYAKEILAAWGEEACVAKMPNEEAGVMREGLKGGIEAEHQDEVRWLSLKLLKQAGAATDPSEAACLERFCDLVKTEATGDARKASALKQLRAIAPLIEPLEQFYQCVIFLFDEVRVQSTENPAGYELTLLDGQQEAQRALEQAARSKSRLDSAMTKAQVEDPSLTAPVVQAMRESGILTLGDEVSQAGSAANAAEVLLQRHAAVQAGKFDRGQQKAPWLRLSGGRARLSSQRNELTRVQQANSWRHVVRHPYRISAASQFIKQCRIP